MPVVPRRKLRDPTRGAGTGAARLSSDRAVRCWVHSHDGRNPRRLLLDRPSAGRSSSQTRPPPTMAQSEVPSAGWRKAGTTSSRHGPHALGDTRATVVGTKGCQPARVSQSQKANPGSDCRLQPACTKSKLLVIAGQHTAVNTFSDPAHLARHVLGRGRY